MPHDIWEVPGDTIRFVEKVLSGHSKVRDFDRTKNILFSIKRVNGDTINMLLLHEYCLGLSAILQARGKFPEADHIVTSGAGFGYTEEAKQHGMANNLGVFSLGEFLGALNWKKPKTYYQKNSEGRRVYAYKSA